jgi:hypothetical protein
MSGAGIARRLAHGALLALVGLAVAPLVSWAVLVAPHAVFIDARSRTAQVFLVNTGTTPEECSIDLKFGYPDTDPLGNIFVRLDSVPAERLAQSAAEWVRAFPRRVVVQPGERQVVRLLAQPPSNLAEGEYWTRMIVTSRGAQVQVGGVTDTTVRAGVALIVSTIISVTYRNGTVRTGVELSDFRAEVEGDSLVVRLGLERQGNAAYLGTVRVQLRDSTGRLAGDWDTPIAVYYRLNRRMTYPLERLPPGRYVAQLDLTTQRDDIPQGQVLPAAPVQRSVAVEVR